MGILRTILAIAVVVYHSYKLFGFRMCGGQVAVEAFYMISGFYMALVLNEKYIGVGSYKKFILSRFYRIFPVYWLVLLCAVLLSLIGYIFFNHPYYLARYISNNQCLSGITIFYFILENLIVLGQDILYFTRLDEYCQPLLTYNVLSYKHTGYQYLFVPQAWSISIEFMFYLIAPFLVTKKIKWQVLIVIISLLCKYWVSYFYYLRFDPWTYRFFPFELGFFILGSLAYFIYKYIEFKNIPVMIGYLLMFSCVLSVVVFNEIQIEETLKNNLFFGLMFLSIPLVFLAFKDNKLDRYIGELSFSIYISHHLVVSVLRAYFFSHPPYLFLYGYAVVFGSLIIAFILQNTVIKKIEGYRLKIF